MGKAVNKKRAIIFGGSLSEINPNIFKAITKNDFLVCADAGYKFVVNNGFKPHLIVGDFDSANYPDDTDCEIIKLPIHKDDTDLHFAVKTVLERGYKSIILTGVTGGRLDHTLASISTLEFLNQNSCEACILDKNSILYVVSSELTVKKPEFDCYLSVFAITPKAKGVFIKGAEYPLENGEIIRSFPIGVSNEFKDDEITLNVKEGLLLVAIVKKN